MFKILGGEIEYLFGSVRFLFVNINFGFYMRFFIEFE